MCTTLIICYSIPFCLFFNAGLLMGLEPQSGMHVVYFPGMLRQAGGGGGLGLAATWVLCVYFQRPEWCSSEQTLSFFLLLTTVHLISQGSPETQNQQDVYRENEIHHKELAHVIMEADKCWDVQSASWRPRKSQCFHLNQKAGKSWSRCLKAGRGHSCFFGEGSAFLFCSGLWWVGWGPSTVGKAICLVYQFKW